MNTSLIALAALVALTVLVLGRAQLRKTRERYIDHYDFARLLDARLAMKRAELTPGQRRLVFRALGEYFHLCRMAGRQYMVSMPSQAVDDAWHEFLLFTRNYDSFCQRALGRFLHHVPAEAMQSPTQAQDGIKRAWRLACLREGIDPLKPSRLPLLFSIDRDLGIADGFRYALDCRQLGARNEANGTIYCGSHIGSGGGCGGGCGGGGSGSADGSSDGGGGCGGGGCGGD